VNVVGDVLHENPPLEVRLTEADESEVSVLLFVSLSATTTLNVVPAVLVLGGDVV
jgi:hypothetical protein